jgi:hypothetical protein
MLHSNGKAVEVARKPDLRYLELWHHAKRLSLDDRSARTEEPGQNLYRAQREARFPALVLLGDESLRKMLCQVFDLVWTLSTPIRRQLET